MPVRFRPPRPGRPSAAVVAQSALHDAGYAVDIYAADLFSGPDRTGYSDATVSHNGASAATSGFVGRVHSWNEEIGMLLAGCVKRATCWCLALSLSGCAFLRLDPAPAEYLSSDAQATVTNAQQQGANLPEAYRSIEVAESGQCGTTINKYYEKRKDIILVVGIAGAAVTGGFGAAAAVGAISTAAGAATSGAGFLTSITTILSNQGTPSANAAQGAILTYYNQTAYSKPGDLTSTWADIPATDFQGHLTNMANICEATWNGEPTATSTVPGAAPSTGTPSTRSGASTTPSPGSGATTTPTTSH